MQWLPIAYVHAIHPDRGTKICGIQFPAPLLHTSSAPHCGTRNLRNPIPGTIAAHQLSTPLPLTATLSEKVHFHLAPKDTPPVASARSSDICQVSNMSIQYLMTPPDIPMACFNDLSSSEFFRSPLLFHRLRTAPPVFHGILVQAQAPDRIHDSRPAWRGDCAWPASRPERPSPRHTP